MMNTQKKETLFIIHYLRRPAALPYNLYVAWLCCASIMLSWLLGYRDFAQTVDDLKTIEHVFGIWQPPVPPSEFSEN